MKKVLLVLLCLGAILVPNQVLAKSYSFGGYYCDKKQPLGDGTFTMTCHIIATTDFEVNHIEGTLILKNVTLKEIKTTGDWSSKNGLSSNVSFKAASAHIGSFAVADLIFTGNSSDTECEASFMPTLAEKETLNQVCAIIDSQYYGKDATIVTEEKYYEDCCNYTCTVVNNKFYFNSKGKSVSYDKFIEDCSTTTTVKNPQTGMNSGYIILPIGILSIIAIIKIAKKNTKIYKI
ncbi:MAG: hypothetical protein K2J20_03665 [Bacilli bacterium]|nr:hypothetical protein [Bacilli bacterium]